MEILKYTLKEMVEIKLTEVEMKIAFNGIDQSQGNLEGASKK